MKMATDCAGFTLIFFGKIGAFCDRPENPWERTLLTCPLSLLDLGVPRYSCFVVRPELMGDSPINDFLEGCTKRCSICQPRRSPLTQAGVGNEPTRLLAGSLMGASEQRPRHGPFAQGLCDICDPAFLQAMSHGRHKRSCMGLSCSMLGKMPRLPLAINSRFVKHSLVAENDSCSPSGRHSILT